MVFGHNLSPAGVLGQAMHENLVQLKSLLEEGETTKEGTTVELR